VFNELRLLLSLVLILSAQHLKWRLFPLILESPPPLSGVTTPSSYKLLFPFIFLFSIALCYSVHLCLFGFHLLSFPYMLFNSAPLHHHHHIIVFSIFPLEVNLHTYLTTWLSSCPVGILFGFLTIFCLK